MRKLKGWRFQKLVHGSQIPTINNFLPTVFKVGLQSYLIIVTIGMKQLTLQQHKEAAMFCEEGMITAKMKSALSIP
jgi:hypothetical protein